MDEGQNPTPTKVTREIMVPPWWVGGAVPVSVRLAVVGRLRRGVAQADDDAFIRMATTPSIAEERGSIGGVVGVQCLRGEERSG